jgi:HAE1 family hydrophobic/amphiphilic exporter-1
MLRSLAFATLVGALAPLAAAEPLSRAQGVKQALEANPDVQKALLDLSALNGRKDQALADALPELKLLGSWSRFRDPSLLNSSSFDAFPPELRDSLRPVPANLYDGTLELRQTLFSFKLGAAIRAARLARSLGDEQVRRARQAVALEAVKAYNQYLLSLEKVRVGQMLVRYKTRQLETAENRWRAGVATELEVLRAKVDLSNRKTQLLTLEGDSDLARAALNAVMVRPINEPVETTDTLDFRPLEANLDEVVRAAWQERPESKALALSERVYSELVTVERAEGRPSLDFFGQWGYSVRKPGNFGNGDFARWSAGVSLTVPLFDGFRTRGKVAEAQATRDKLRQDEVALENQIRLEAQAGLDALRVARSVLESSELNVSQARRALEMTQANAEAGAATFLDVLDTQAALTEAESQRILALHAHANARATLRYVMALDVLDDSPFPAGAPAAGAQP